MKSFLVALMVSAPFAQASTFAGCQPADFVTIDGDAQVDIAGLGYSPKCLRIKAGSSVSIAASSRHPLQGVGEANPILDAGGAVTVAKIVAFATPGEYGYFCTAHGDASGNGMAGVIVVE